MLGPRRFVFLNVEHDLAAGGWDDPAMERLWRYNLHYFDDLNAAGSQARAAWHQSLVRSWVAENQPGRGTGWEPYPTSLRIVNWIKWFAAGQVPEPAWLDSLATQVRWLTGRLEWHLLGNHLFVNAKALVAAGLYFDGPEADAWLARGLEILARELPEQILPDGGQFERSPMYHALALEDLLDMVNLAQALTPSGSEPPAWLEPFRISSTRMLHWLRCMCHGNGELGLFNDCADGIAPPLAELERLAAALHVRAAGPAHGLTYLPDSGYVSLRQGAALLLADLAPLGPDYLVGHAHADTLAFELSLGPDRVVVNGGTSCYGLSAQRLAERGTAAHSTVTLAGQDSSEVWSGFRVGRRARPVEPWIGDAQFSCAHDGYSHLAGSPQHRRTWRMSDGELMVEDEVSGGTHEAIARYPLAPGLALRPLADGGFEVRRGPLTLATVHITVGQSQVVSSSHAQRFGLVVPNQTLTVNLTNGRAATRWRWKPDAHPVSH